MSDHRLANLNEADFDAIVEAHIERTAQGAGELPANICVDILFERLATNTAPITLVIDVQDGHSRSDWFNCIDRSEGIA